MISVPKVTAEEVVQIENAKRRIAANEGFWSEVYSTGGVSSSIRCGRTLYGDAVFGRTTSERPLPGDWDEAAEYVESRTKRFGWQIGKSQPLSVCAENEAEIARLMAIEETKIEIAGIGGWYVERYRLGEPKQVIQCGLFPLKGRKDFGSGLHDARATLEDWQEAYDYVLERTKKERPSCIDRWETFKQTHP